MHNSILNDVLGPIMRGPSSSHTAGSHHIGQTLMMMLGDTPTTARFTFDPGGSYVRTYSQQGVDRAFAAALLEWELTDARFLDALNYAAAAGIDIDFCSATIAEDEHPNTVRVRLGTAKGGTLEAVAKSTGGGTFSVCAVNGFPVSVSGKSHVLLVTAANTTEDKLSRDLASILPVAMGPPRCSTRDVRIMLQFAFSRELPGDCLSALRRLPGVTDVRTARPVYAIPSGTPLFNSGEELAAIARQRGWSLGEAALRNEMQVLDMSRQDALEAMHQRYAVMHASVEQGLDSKTSRMQLLAPSADSVLRAERNGHLPGGGATTRAAARALAAMHTSNSFGVVCAAPTGGSAGVIPGLIHTLVEDKGLAREQAALLLYAAGAIGLIIANRATFAAEVAGCQVEIGAAGAMAAAAVAEAGQAPVSQALDAAAIALQNTMGSPCDLVQGMCEIPCHTRNAVAAASAYTCADLILGGYHNPIPLDETIDAVYAVGKMLPTQLRCTSLGGLAQTPSALALKHRE